MSSDTSFRLLWQSWCQYLGPIDNVDLADVCEVSGAAVTGWLNGSRKPRANKITRLSQFIYKLIKERKVEIAPYNRADFVTISTNYDHQGEFPSESHIRATFEGTMTVEEVLGINLEISELCIKSNNQTVIKNPIELLKTYATTLSILFAACLVSGAAVVMSGVFTAPQKLLFQHSELALSVDGEVRKISLSEDGLQRAFLWKPPGGDNFDVYLVDKQHVITPITQSEENELGLDWSPLGNTLALLRITQSGNCEFVLLNIETRKETLLTECNRKTHTNFVWSRDGEHLYYTSRKKANQPSALFSYSINNGETHQLTFPENISYGDYRVIESLDGNKLAFLRSDRWSYSELRTLDLKTSNEELLKEFDQIVFTMDWGFDDNEIFVVPWQSPNQIVSIGADGQSRIINRRSRPIGDFQTNAERQEIILQEKLFTEDIYKSPLNTGKNNSSKLNKSKPIISSTRRDWQVKLSPDNQSLAFLSNRSGTTELWISNVDGESARPVTKGQVQGMQIFDWSPDGNKIVVDSSDDRIYVITLVTEKIQAYSPIGFAAKNPSWSHDNNKIYVASDSSQSWQIWAIDQALSSPQQITSAGGFSARESQDGHALFHTRFYEDGIWQISLVPNTTNQPKRIVESVNTGAWQQWQLINESLYFVESNAGGLSLMNFDLENQQLNKLLTLPNEWMFDFSIFIGKEEKNYYFSEKTMQQGSEYILIR